MKKDRTIQDLDGYLGNFSEEFRKKLNKKNKIKILDAGCGYGLVMAGLIKKFGNRVEIIGYNKTKEDGTINDFKEKSIRMDIFSKKKIQNISNPKMIYLDANQKLPFNNEEFDFIYSLASVYLYENKIAFFQECNRILNKNGKARIHLFELKKNKTNMKELRKIDMKTYLKISKNGKEVNNINYLTKIKGVSIKFGKRMDNNHIIIYLELKKQTKLDFNLKMISFVDNGLNGIKSIYEIK